MQTWEVLAEESLFAAVETVVPARTLPDEDIPQEPRLGPGSVSISWRGDGAYFATACSAGPGDPPPHRPLHAEHKFHPLPSSTAHGTKRRAKHVTSQQSQQTQ